MNLIKPTLAEASSRFHTHHPRYNGCIYHGLMAGGGGSTVWDVSRSSHGTISGAVWAAGRFGGGAISFDGTSDDVTLLDTSILNNIAPVTYLFWCYPREVALKFLIGKWDGVNARQTVTLHSGNQLVFTKNGSTQLIRRSGVALDLNAWNHCAVSWTGGTSAANDIAIYLNGQLITSASLLQDGASLTSDVGFPYRVGWRASGTASFDGIIEDIRIYNRVLTQGEIQSIRIEPYIEFRRPTIFAVGGGAIQLVNGGAIQLVNGGLIG